MALIWFCVFIDIFHANLRRVFVAVVTNRHTFTTHHSHTSRLNNGNYAGLVKRAFKHDFDL